METEINLCKVNPSYIKFMHGVDNKVSVKYNNRPFVGIVTMLNGVKYVLPLTSQITSDRKAAGKSKRAAIITTFVRDTAGEEIANILHNNMFPVKDGVYQLLEIDSEKDSYESNEIRYIRKNKDKIINKAQKLHKMRIKNPNAFLLKTCCDFEKLESLYDTFILPTPTVV